jgi:hypothetical protein
MNEAVTARERLAWLDAELQRTEPAAVACDQAGNVLVNNDADEQDRSIL